MKEDFLKLVKQHFLLVLSVCVSFVLLSYVLGRCSKECPEPIERVVITVDTVIKYDTVVQEIPKYYTKILTDTLVEVKYVEKNGGSAKFNLPLYDVTYKTDRYKAIVRGYEPSLRFMEIYDKTVYVDRVTDRWLTTKTHPRWGLGLQAGGTYDLFNKRFQLYIGAGVQYNIFTW